MSWMYRGEFIGRKARVGCRGSNSMNEAPGIPLQDIWDDVGAMHNLSGERLNYPTQKPEALLKRIIKLHRTKVI